MKYLNFISINWRFFWNFFSQNNKTFDINDFVLKKLEDLKTFSTLKQPTIHERDL